MAYHRLPNRTGQWVNHWFIEGPADRPRPPGSPLYWKCRCICGLIRDVQAGNIENGSSVSCGCVHKTKHGGIETTEYTIWKGIKQRCLNPKNKHYDRYGGRGINVCERWLHSFPNFLADVGKRPSKQHSLDRFPNNDGNYEPGNVRWATQSQQMRNACTNVYVSFRGETDVFVSMIEKTSLNQSTVRRRLSRGWTIELALTSSPRRGHRPPSLPSKEPITAAKLDEAIAAKTAAT